MAVTTITQFPELPLSGSPTGAHSFVLPVDASIGGNLGTYKITLDQMRNFVLNTSRSHSVSGSDNLLIAGDGNVGIGPDVGVPNKRLSVAGAVSATGSITSDTGFIGNVSTATSLQTSRTFQLKTGDISTATIAFDGTNNVHFHTTIIPNAVTTGKIKDKNITTAKIADDAITSGQIMDRQVRAEHIQLDHIRSEHILAGAVKTSEIADLNVTENKIAAGAVTTNKIAGSQITNAHLKSGIVSSAVIVDAAVSTAKIADGAITTAKYKDVSVTSAKLHDGAVITSKLATAAVTNAKILNSTITHAKLQNVSGVAGTYGGNAEYTVNDRGIITSVNTQVEALRVDGGTLTGKLTLAGNSTGGLYWDSLYGANGDYSSITWEHISGRHTLKLKVHGADPTEQTHGLDDRILFEVPNLSGVSVKVGDNEYPVWHAGHVPDVAVQVQGLMDEYFFTGFKPDGGTLRTAQSQSGQTLVLTSDDVKTALGFTPMPNTRAQITGNLGFEPLSRTRSREHMTGHLCIGSTHGSHSDGQSLFVNGHARIKGMLALDRTGSGWGGEILLKPHENGNSFIYVNSGNNRVQIGPGAFVGGANKLRIQAGNSHLNLQAQNHYIYHQSRGHIFNYYTGNGLATIRSYNDRGHMKVGGTDSGFHGRLEINSKEHNGFVLYRTGSHVKLQLGVTDENVTLGTYGAGRSLFRIQSGAERNNGQTMMEFTKNNSIYINSQACYFRNSDNVARYAYINVKNNNSDNTIQFSGNSGTGNHNAIQFGNGCLQFGTKGKQDVIYLKDFSNTGLVGIGTTTPTHNAMLTVKERPSTHASILCMNSQNNGGIWLGHNWEHRGSRYGAIHNATDGYRTLMIVGNSTGGAGRKVSVWDRMTVGNVGILGHGDSRLSVHGSGRFSGYLKVDQVIQTRRVEESQPSDFAIRAYAASYHHQNKTDPDYYNNLNRGVYVNGKSISQMAHRGINTVIIKPDGTYRNSNHHDTYGHRGNWNYHIDWIYAAAKPGDVVVCTMQDASKRLMLPIRGPRNSRDTIGNSAGSTKHPMSPTEKASNFYLRMGAREIFAHPDTKQRMPMAWAFIMPKSYKKYQADAKAGYIKEASDAAKYYEGFDNFCFLERVAKYNHGYISIGITYNQLLALGGEQSAATYSANGATKSSCAPQRVSMSVNHVTAKSVIKTEPDMMDHQYPPSGDAQIFTNPYYGYGNGHQDRGYAYHGIAEPYYWRDHTHSWDDWSYSRGRRRNHTWYERYMIRCGWGHQSNHYGGMRFRIPSGVDTLWLQNHSGWGHWQLFYLHKNGTRLSQAPGRHPRYGYKKRSGIYGNMNADYDQTYTPWGGPGGPGKRQWLGDWTPIPLDKSLLEDFPYVTAVQKSSSSSWLTGVAFGRNPWNHTYSSAVNLHWRLNGGDYMWWSGHWWYRYWCYAHSWHNRYLRIPVIFNGKDKMLYAKSHHGGWNGGGDGWSVEVNGVECGVMSEGWTNPFEASTRSEYLGSRYIGIHIPKEVIMKHRYSGAGHVSSSQYWGETGYLNVRILGGRADRSWYMSEMGTHDYAPDPYIVHSGLGDQTQYSGPMQTTHLNGGVSHPYYPGASEWPGY